MATNSRRNTIKCQLMSNDSLLTNNDRICGLVVSVPGYRSRGPGFDSPALPDFLRSGESGTGSTQPREDN
jgi:hypothetical protein